MRSIRQVLFKLELMIMYETVVPLQSGHGPNEVSGIWNMQHWQLNTASGYQLTHVYRKAQDPLTCFIQFEAKLQHQSMKHVYGLPKRDFGFSDPWKQM